MEEQTPLAAAEVYLFTWRGHLCFLPGLPWLPLGRWHLPKSQVSQSCRLQPPYHLAKAYAHMYYAWVLVPYRDKLSVG